LRGIHARADSKQTLLRTYLSAVLLVGLVANAAFGGWWADPTAGHVGECVVGRHTHGGGQRVSGFLHRL